MYQIQNRDVLQKEFAVFDERSVDKRVEPAHYRRSNVVPNWIFCEVVTIRATKGLEHCIDVARRAYLIILPQESHSTLVFQQAPTIEFTHKFSIKQCVFHKRKCSGAEGPQQLEYRLNGIFGTGRAESILTIDEQIENY